MLDNTVNNKKEISDGAAGINNRCTTTAVAWQNNKPQKLEIEVTNSKETQNLPFMIDNADIVQSTDKTVIVRAKAITKEDNEKRRALQEDRNKAGENR